MRPFAKQSLERRSQGPLHRRRLEEPGGVKIRDAARFVLDQLYAEWQHLEAQLRDLTRRLKEFAAAAPPHEAEARAKLKTAPKIGPVTIDVIVSELGDVRRFHSSKAVSA
jgi:transposase